MSGVSPDTIRYYERLGILPHAPRTASGYRMYTPESVERVRLVQRALQLGFTLAELSDILKTRDKGGIPCRRVLQLAEEKLVSLGRRIAELQQTELYMKALVRHWRATLSQTAPGSKALLLHSLADGLVASPPKKLRRKR